MPKKRKKYKILLMHHSGSGSTRTVSEVLRERLLDHYEVDSNGISKDFDYKRLSEYDLILLGYPTYYFQPSLSTTKFVEKIPALGKKIPFYIFTTYGLYSGNSIRTLANMLRKKNITVMNYSQVRGPASDGVLLLPSFFRLFFRYEGKANDKVDKMIKEIKGSFDDTKRVSKIPLPRWYYPVTSLFSKYIHGIDYSTYRKNLKVLKDRCNNCNICVDGCINNCWEKGKDKPSIDTDKCEFCLKCVHNCPVRAIVFTEKMKDSPRLDKAFYNKLKRDTFSK